MKENDYLFNEIMELWNNTTTKYKANVDEKYDNHRKIFFRKYPRQIHFEFLKYNDRIGVEFHRETVKYPEILSILMDCNEIINTHSVEYDPNWHKGKGRIRMVISYREKKEIIISCMQKLISYIENKI